MTIIRDIAALISLSTFFLSATFWADIAARLSS